VHVLSCFFKKDWHSPTQPISVHCCKTMAPQRMETPPPIITIPSTTTTTKSWSRNMHHTRDISISSLPQQQQKNNDSPCRIEDGYYIFEDDNILPATTATAKVTVLSVDLEEEASPIQHQHQQQQYCCIYFPIPSMLYTFCYWYSAQMDTHPVSTKSITGGCSSILGDVIAQFVETPYANYWGVPFNYRRTFAMFCTGLCFGPILHYTYEFYEYVLPINIDAGCVDTVVTPMRECNTVKCGGEGFPSQTMSTNDMLLLADGTRIMMHDKQLSSSNTTNNHHHDNNQHVERNNNNDNDFSIRSNNTLVEENVDSTETTTTHYHQETTTYFCHSTMFHSYYTISRRKFINAILHVVIDQGIMGFVFIALMMLITGIIEGHWDTLRTIFVNDYITNIHLLWLVALFVIGPIQIMAFRYLSLKWRALSVSCLDVLEVTIMSVITHRNLIVPSA